MNAVENYNQLIRFRINNPLPDDVYGERHHVVPRACGGTEYENIIRLTPEEHYEAHRLLKDIYSTGKEHRSMIFAWRCMVVMNGVPVSQEIYAKIRREYSIAMSTALKGHRLSQETKEKIRAKLKGKIGNRKGAHHSLETRLLLSQKSKGNKNCVGKKVSDETRRKISESLKGNKNRCKKAVGLEFG